MAFKKTNTFKIKNNYSGFTIVELLIVVVVIAILAAITIVAYNGISSQAKESALKSDLTTAAKKLQIAKVQDSEFPSTKPVDTNSTKFQYTSTADTFCLTTTSPNLANKAFSIDQTGTIQNTPCPGHTTGGSGGGTEIAANSPIQSVTQLQCGALPVFDGSNTSAIRTVTDVRGGTTRTYEIAKLADNKCWMLTNLKLGSTTGPVTLTSADSNVASSFTLPQLYSGGDLAQRDYDTPKAYGPAPGDTSGGATNYGYFYNWAAATAGETRTTKPAGSGNTQYSICPASWRLPSAGVYDTSSGWPYTLITPGDFSGLDIAFGGAGAYVGGGESNIAKWQPTGPFRGTLSGVWWGGFEDQGGNGDLWSSSVRSDDADYAFGAYFDSDGVNPGDYDDSRNVGSGVRCLLN